MPDVLPEDVTSAVAAAADRLGPFAALRQVAEIGSTNDAALLLAAAGAPEGTSILADRQTAGRGRRGRVWFSPPGAGLYLSIVLRTDAAWSSWPMVTIAAGVAAGEAVREVAGLPIELKWPNDLVIGRPWRKLGGVLCESSGVGARLDAMVVGIGINLRSAAYPPEVAGMATSIETELGRPIDRAPLVVALLARLRGVISTLRGDGTRPVGDRWRQLGRAGLGGAAIRWKDGDRDVHGVARDIADDGALVVEREGHVEQLVAGEVTWERWTRV
jgi:BirA family biotin operon repressor/biotin-[acetyl-CoA-carboxylase] ligase